MYNIRIRCITRTIWINRINNMQVHRNGGFKEGCNGQRGKTLLLSLLY